MSRTENVLVVALGGRVLGVSASTGAVVWSNEMGIGGIFWWHWRSQRRVFIHSTVRSESFASIAKQGIRYGISQHQD